MSAIELESVTHGGATGVSANRAATDRDPEAAGLSQRAEVWKRFRKNKLAMIGLGMIVVLVLMAVFAPALTALETAIGGTDVSAEQSLGASGQLTPSSEHWFGTDRTGRDIFARIVYGARISLMVGFSVVAISLVIGMTFGALAGYYGGIIETIVMRLTDVALALPYIVLAIALVVLFGQTLLAIIIILAVTGWTSMARIFRSAVLQVKGQEFVEAARAIGCNDRRIILRHVLPNAIQPVIVYATLAVGAFILSEAALSFLGVGAQPPTPSWGLMITEARNSLRNAPHMLFFPAAFLALTILAFTLVGDGLRDSIDPKLKK